MNINSFDSISDLELQLVAEQSGILICRYYLKDHRMVRFYNDTEARFHVPKIQENVPASMIETGNVMEESIDDYLHFYEEMDRGEASGQSVIRLRMRNIPRWFHVKFTMIYDHDRNPLYAFIIFLDITETREMELASEKWRTSLSALLTDSIMYAEVNLSQNLIDRIVGDKKYGNHDQTKTLDEFVDNGISNTVEEKIRKEYFEFFKRDRLIRLYFSGVNEDRFDYHMTKQNGELIWIQANIRMGNYPHSNDIMAIIAYVDISHQKSQLEQMTHKAVHDSLTGVLNREGIQSNASKLLEEYNPVNTTAMFIVDLDDFKLVNDHLGHQYGDTVLINVAETLSSAFTKDDVVGRLGGDEFVVILSRNISLNDLKTKAWELIKAMKFELGDKQQIPISISIGISYAHSLVSFESLYRNADISMYTAKRSGKCCFHMIDLDSNVEGSYLREGDTSTMMPLQTLLNYVDTAKDFELYIPGQMRTPYQALIRNMPSGVVVIELGKGEKIIHCNDWMYHFTGYSRAEMASLHKGGILAITHPDDCPAMVEAIQDIRNGADEASVTFRIYTKEGVYKYVTLNASVTERNHDSIIVYGVYADVNELMNIRDELSDYRKKLEAIIAVMPGGLAKFEITAEDFTISHLGNWIYQYTGFDEKELKRLRNGEAMGSALPEDQPVLRNALQKVRQGQDRISLTYHTLHKDGYSKLMNVSGAVSERSDDMIIMYVIFSEA